MLVLVVDDSVTIQGWVKMILTLNHYEVAFAESGEEAIEQLNKGLSPNLILMDIELEGGINGIETAKIINAQWDIPIVFLSANTYHEVMNKIKEVKAYSFIPKGSPSEVVLTVIDMVLKLKKESDWFKIFKTIFDHIGLELYLFHQDSLKFFQVNQSALNNLGYNEEELRQLTPLEIKPEFKPQQFQELLIPLLQNQQNEITFETYHKRKNGSLYPIKIVLQPITYNDTTFFLAIGQDLSDLTNLKKTIDEKDSLLSSLMEKLSEAVVLSENDLIIFWNQRATELFGYSNTEAMGKRLPDLLFPETSKKQLQELLPNLEKHQEVNTIREFHYVNQKGQHLDLEISCAQLNLGKNTITITLIRDQTERKQLLKQFQESLAEFSNLADNSPVGIIQCDDKGDILYLNQEALTILHYDDLKSILGLNLSDLPHFHGINLGQTLDEVIQNHVKKTLEVEYSPTPISSLWLSLTLAPVWSENQILRIHIIISDITEKKIHEQQILEHNRIMQLFVEGLVSPAWLITKEREIIFQNKAAEQEFKTRIGDFCWGAIQHCKLDSSTSLSLGQKSLPSHCSFCLSEQSLKSQERFNELIEVKGNFWDVWWIPLNKEMYLHYATNVTKYKEMEKKLELAAITDGLLGIYNRRYCSQRLQAEIYRAKRYQSLFSIILMDIDHFKSINDNYGHDVGDAVLKSVANAIQSRLRQSDVFGRWGGEEFILILPETDLSHAAQLAENLQRLIMDLIIHPVSQLTVSQGLAEFQNSDTELSILKRADECLYKAKEEGRNRVMIKNE